MTKYWEYDIALEDPNGLDYQSWVNDTPVHNPNTPEPEVQQVNPSKFIQTRSKSTRPQFLTPYTEKQLAEFKLFLIGKDVGYALTPKKELVNVFNNSGVQGVGAEAVIDAISKGVKTLNCFSGYLCDYYKQFGFTEVFRKKWNNGFAPANWNQKKYGCPAVVYMEYSGDRDITRLRHQVIGPEDAGQRIPQANQERIPVMNLSISYRVSFNVNVF